MSGINLQSTKMILRSLINSTPNGMTVKDLERDYMQQEGRRIPFVELGYSRLLSFLHSINDTLRVYPLPSGDYQVHAIQTKESAHVAKLVLGQKISKCPKNRARIRQPRRIYNAPAQMQTFYETYPKKFSNNVAYHPSNQYKIALPLKPPATHDHTPVTNYSKAIPAGMEDGPHLDAFNEFSQFDYDDDIPETMKRPDPAPKTLSTPSKAQFEEVTHVPVNYSVEDNISLCMESVSIQPAEDSYSSVSTVSYADYIGPARLPDGVGLGALLRVFVSEINSPSRFWFHIQSEHNPLDHLMFNIEKAYTAMKPAEHRINPSDAVPGQICAALYMGYWHRGEIVRSNTDQDTVVVHFVDYGTTTAIQMDDVKYLLAEFAVEPNQVYRGCLDHIQPIGKRWSRDATYAFLALANDVQLFAKVTALDSAEHIIRMLLINTQQDHDIQINVEMIDRGFAEPSDLPIPSPTTRRHASERRPTFVQLESGSYPSFSMLGFLLAHGIDLDVILDEQVGRAGDPKTPRAIAHSFHPTNPFRSMLIEEADELSDSSNSNNESNVCRKSDFVSIWDNTKPTNI